jgi:YYY domain-containing protein
VFESFPTIDIPGVLRWEANDQFAEEAFTVYDHPKVLIFQKQADFSASKVQALLAAVDLGHVVHLTPSQAGTYKSLMLSPAALAVQQAGGTWSQLFDYRWIQNRFPAVGLLVWYLFILVLGVLTYPIVRLAFPGLGDKGYPVARVLGIVLLGYFSWLSGSAGLPVTRMTVWIVFAGLAAAGLVLGWIQRAELAQEWKSRRNYFLIIEAFFLAFFVIDLLIRLGNPDLWHPAKGGERPMDFSYFNAVLRSTSFPPYDPWFAGGYINYYYYGFVLLAMPVKLLGLVPTIAYNFILPTLFAMVAMGAFCVGWNLLDGSRGEGRSGEPADRIAGIDRRLVAGLLAAALLVLLGNLGTVRMLYQGLGRLAAPAASLEGADVVQRLLWAVQGAGRMLGGAGLPYGTGDWYWNPSRVIPPGPGNEITEFPLFTFLYSDLHAHMLAMPLAVLALAWALSVVRSRSISWISLLIGGITIGALYPTNLSDIYTYLPLGFAVVTYAIWHSKARGRWSFGPPDWLRKLALTVGCVVLLTALSYGLYEPYRAAYSQGYGALDPWTTSHTPIWSYLTHWGIFLFIITGWLAWETRQWLESTPLSSLNKLRPYQVVIEVGIAFVLAALLYLAYRGVEIGWVALPLAAWAGALMLRPGLPDVKRFALFIAGTALLITLVVEIVVVRGDIGRMNTVFKFYLQAWALLSVSSAAALIWLLPAMRQWLPGWRRLMEGGTAVLLAGAALYTITAGTDKISDRMAARVPLTLDSITYMQYAQYADFGETMDLVHDYRAIRWMQDHVQGSPVIVEANCPEYRWCTRFTIYTGLPGVVGWNWHQRQQRTLTTQLVEDRVGEIADFYKTSDARTASDFLRRYNVSYIILGQLERAEYAGAGLEKFAQYNGQLWDAVYQEGDTAIYEVRP